MKSNVRVRQATPADVPTIAHMKLEFAREEGYPETVRASEQDWLRDLFSPSAHFCTLLAECDGEIVGMLIYGEKFCPAWPDPIIYILDLFVEPVWRRHGVGTTLLQHVAGRAIRNNVPLMELNVREDNPARQLYSRAGFQHLPHCLTYIIAGPGLMQLAGNLTEFAGLF
jgi:ribosomal protein S18 acetylase RimI-like enzyme